MSLWTVFKLFAALGVMVVMAFTGALAYHILVAPLDGLFAKIIPNPAEVIGTQPDADFAKMLDSTELPDIDPGEKAFQKAHELLALGELAEAREKLTAIVNVYPTSSAAPTARRIVGEMNLDEILSTKRMEGKKSHIVKRGNSFLGIASQYKTTLDMIMFLNGMMELKNIQPGEELIVMPLEFRLLIEPQRKSISVWDDGKFVREYPILHMAATPPAKGKTTIASKAAELDGHRVQPQSKDYRAAEKVIQLAKPTLQIRGASGAGEDAPRGIVIRSQDMEEISLLTRVGNEVEIR
ncbi:LysM peptidoglycan-binding domain-containing protein [Luteolibacter yonseiensis]|uniref:LysM peptidoglycan-binding domain-containing protein n=1 Tax=Luteolibacter yonseiensis TaxID=1144680 RepID=A0A934R9M9_9BACT|nr:LysM domain-containing protein [Luteolibacter yonseiensis]MBK1818458.1 LysM peptidoglycan-binding domain-containing protein [Luteolibacter yonseiensis]